ncbi:MAG: pcrA [Chthonomonadaceae bacterium]|nr:pcrA [Chthonomonadaceae bacterium]
MAEPPTALTNEDANPADLHPLLRGLNPVQREAVLHGDGPLLLFAGAGSGKTRVLTHRVAYLISERNVSPYNIMAVTFTNKAAKEMKERIGKILNDEGKSRHLTVGTFHATCARLLREHGEKIGLRRDFLVFDDSDQLTLMRDCLRQLQIDDKQFTPRSILSRISNAKEKLITPETWAQHFKGFIEDICGKVYPLYQDKLEKNNALDFDDLLVETVRLFEESSATLERLQERFRYILVDEYQDVNYVQYMFLKQLAAKRRNLCVVGDDDQSVYAFRGANVELILQFEHDYPEAKVLKLEQNYRSSKTILDAAYGVVRHNRGRKDKKLWTDKDAGIPLTRIDAANEQEEAVKLVERVRDDIKQGKRNYGDYAVLYRTNAQSRVLEEVFKTWRVPSRIIGGVRYFDRKEVKDALAYLRVVQSPADSVSLRRIINVPARGIGATTLRAIEEEMNLSGRSFWEILSRADQLSQIQKPTRKRLADFVALILGLQAERDNMSVTDLAQAMLDRTGLLRELEAENDIDRVENVKELLSTTRQYESEALQMGETPSLGGFLENVSLVADIDNLDPDAEAVTMMTLHAAKGLEFPVVFLVGMEENIFPHLRSRETDAEMEEERRLCYVGITRAMEELVVSRADRRTLYGGISFNPPSRFLREIPGELFYKESSKSGRGPSVSSFDPDADDYSYRKPANPQKLWNTGTVSPTEQKKTTVTDEYRVGQKVRHEKFGVGVILNVSGDGANRQVEVVFPTVGPKRLALAYAKLVPVK